MRRTWTPSIWSLHFFSSILVPNALHIGHLVNNPIGIPTFRKGIVKRVFQKEKKSKKKRKKPWSFIPMVKWKLKTRYQVCRIGIIVITLLYFEKYILYRRTAWGNVSDRFTLDLRGRHNLFVVHYDYFFFFIFYVLAELFISLPLFFNSLMENSLM